MSERKASTHVGWKESKSSEWRERRQEGTMDFGKENRGQGYKKCRIKSGMDGQMEVSQDGIMEHRKER